MYKEEIILDKARANALIPSGFLFYRHNDGKPYIADKLELDMKWGETEFFVCTHPVPRTIPPLKVSVLIGANAYACIDENGRKTDILLMAGKGASASLREYAKDQRQRADLAERAAVVLESKS